MLTHYLPTAADVMQGECEREKERERGKSAKSSRDVVATAFFQAE
jgi:hypothetical protein